MIQVNYNDKNYDYTKYWDTRTYENVAEQLALKKLLAKNISVIDIGGGFGRLLPTLTNYFTSITIFDSSSTMLKKAQETANRLGVKATTIDGDVEQLTKATSKKYDTAVMIRVSHHLQDITKAIKEVNNILDKNGVFILEVANKIHFKNVIASLIRGKLTVFTSQSINRTKTTVSFFNHHPRFVEKVLIENGFCIEDRLSVSNFRWGVFKKLIPFKPLLFLEDKLQKPLAKIYFGPSIFYKTRKLK